MESILELAFNVYLCFQSYQLIKKTEEHFEGKNWLFRIWNSSFFLIICWTIITFLLLATEDSFTITAFLSSFYILISCWLFYLIYSGVVNLNLINSRRQINQKLQTVQIVQKSILPETVQHTSLKSSTAEKNSHQADTWHSYFTEINSLMQEKHLYRNEDLSVADLAAHAGISPGYLAQIIKEHTHKNVPTWINEFRLADVKAMLSDEQFQDYTILAIGLEAGFKSKSSFYNTFKQQTGTTPAAFRKKQS